MICRRVARASSDGEYAGVLAHVLLQQRPAVGLVQDAAGVERVDDQPLVRIVGMQVLQRAHQEVTGKVHPLHAHAGAPAHLDVDQRQRDGDARLLVEHLVEAAVPRVVVVLAVAGEPQLVEQVLVERIDPRTERGVEARVAGDAVGRGNPHLVDSIEIRLRIEVRVFEPRDQERRRGQIGSGPVGRVHDPFGERAGRSHVNQQRGRPVGRASGPTGRRRRARLPRAIPPRCRCW